MRLPELQTDYWRLLSGEERHAKSPETFEIPSRTDRENLSRGSAAKLLFEIESENERGDIETNVERMWVIVSEKIGDTYIGILDCQPVTIESSEDEYLCFGAEVPFKAEHVIEIGAPPEKYAEWQLNQKPERIWHRG